MTPEQIAEARALVNAGSRMNEVIPAMIAEYRRRVELHDNLTGACVELRREKGQQARDFNAATADTLATLLDALEAAQATIAELQADADEAFAIATEAGRVMGEAVDGMKAAEAKLEKAVEAVDKAAALIEERHVVHMTAKGRNPKDYVSEWSLIAKEVRAMLAAVSETHKIKGDTP